MDHKTNSCYWYCLFPVAEFQMPAFLSFQRQMKEPLFTNYEMTGGCASKNRYGSGCTSKWTEFIEEMLFCGHPQLSGFTHQSKTLSSKYFIWTYLQSFEVLLTNYKLIHDLEIRSYPHLRLSQFLPSGLFSS